MKGVMIEIGKLIYLSVLSGLLIIAVVSFVATPAMITRHIITSASQEDPHLLYYCVQAGLIGAVVIFIIQFIFRTFSET